MKKILATFAILLIVVAGIYFTRDFSNGRATFSFFKKPTIVTIDNHSFNVVIAKSEKELEIGLSETKSLAQNQGMIFLFNKLDYYSFWMKDMKFPIDIIFINIDHIVTIEDNVPIITGQKNPSIYTPTQTANRVLEIQAGLAKKYNFKIGDNVKYENLGN